MLRPSQDGEIHRQTGFDFDHISFADLRFDREGIEVGEFDDGRGGLVGVDGLAFFGHHRYYRAIHWGNHTAIAQVECSGIDAELGLADLRVDGGEFGLGGFVGGLGTVVVCLGGGLIFEQLALALPCEAGLIQGSFTDQLLRLLVGKGGFGVFELVLLGERVDLRNHLAFFDVVTERDRQLGLLVPMPVRRH
jgi:hypothetical protein